MSKKRQILASSTQMVLHLPENAGTIILPIHSLDPKEEKAIKATLTLMFMAFRSAVLQSITDGNSEGLGNALNDLMRVIELKIPSIRKLLEAAVMMIGEKIEKSSNEMYQMGLNDASMVLIDVLETVYQPHQAEGRLITDKGMDIPVSGGEDIIH